MKTSRNFGGIRMRVGLILGALLPFIVCLFLLPEPSQSESEDYLPSARARSVNAKIIKSLKSLPGDCAGGVALTAGAQWLAPAIYSTAIRAETSVKTRHFDLLIHRAVRSPPKFSL
jgi:hypothetical protein